MPKVVRKSLAKMTFVLGLLFAMAYWQEDFVITAITANVFLNSCILGTFAFGVAATFSRTYKLRNEFVSFRALREDYDDAVNGAEQDEKDPMWRYYRCQSNAILFVPPKILERPYTILSEEIGRRGQLSVSTSVMQNLLDSVDEQLDDGKALGSYITGLLVFLGLIGTFVGLMVTLSSVGAIIGGLDLTGGAGNDAIQGLMTDLQVPLQGMATGFSSSLFGLITSLVLGLISLFSNQAAGTLKSDFGTWLAGVAKVEGEDGLDNSRGHNRGTALENEKMLSVMYRVAKITLASNAKVVNTVTETYENSSSILRNQLHTNEQFLFVSESLADISNGFATTTDALSQIVDQLESKGQLAGVMRKLHDAILKQEGSLKRTNENFSTLLVENKELLNRASLTLETKEQLDTLEKSILLSQEGINEGFSVLHGSSLDVSKTLEEIKSHLGESKHLEKITRNDLVRLSSELRTDLSHFIEVSKRSNPEEDRRDEEFRELEYRLLNSEETERSLKPNASAGTSRLGKLFSRFKKQA